MPLKLLFVSFLFLVVSSCTPDIDVEEEVYTNLKKEFKKEKTDLKKELNKLERFLVEKDVLSSKSSKSKRAYLKFVAKNDSFPILENFEDRLVVLISPLDLQFLASAIKAFEKSNKEAFKGSELKALMDRLESGDLEQRSSPKTIAKALLKVDNEEFKKPLFRAMTLILIASSMSDRLTSNDMVLRSEDDFFELNGFHSYDMVMLGCSMPYPRFDIAINYQNQLLIRGSRSDDPNLISNELTKFITINRSLTRDQIEAVLRDKNHNVFYYPFYYYTTLEEIEENIEESYGQLKRCRETPGVSQDMIEFCGMQYMKWNEKLESIRLSKRNVLEEIDFQTSIEIKFMEGTSEAFIEKVYEELYESIYMLRNKESMELFGEDFETIRSRQNIFLNDFNKLRLIEILFPVRITENPGQFYPKVEAVPPPQPVDATEPPFVLLN